MSTPERTVEQRYVLLQQRIDALQQRLAAAPAQAAEVLPEALQELRTALEELHVADEELRRQNDALAEARRSAEAERRRYQELFDLAPDGYLVTDTAGVILEANQATAVLLDRTPEFLAGKPLALFVSEPERRAFRTLLHRLRRLERVHDHDVTMQPTDRPAFPAALTVVAIRTPQGHTSGLRWLLRDVTPRQQAEAAKRQLLTRLVTAQEEERRRLSYELHDHLGQSVSSLMLWLHILESHCQAVDLQPLQTLATTLAQDVRDLAWVLRPPELNNKDIETVLGDYVEEWAQRAGITADFLCTGFPHQDLAPHLAVTLYRLLQEALTNVLRHAQTQRVSVLLTCHGEVVQAVIEDHGRGFDVAAVLDGPPSRRLGLQGMRERAALVGGTVALESAPGVGTTVFVRLPLQPLDSTPSPSETTPRPPGTST